MATVPDTDPQASTSHMMKTTKRGRPFLKACPLQPHYLSLSYHILGYSGFVCHTHRLSSPWPTQTVLPYFSPLFFNVMSLFFYFHSWIFLISSSSDEAAQNLASLKFSQSNRGPDPREPSRVVTTTTTTTFSMTRDMAKAMSQHFMDARLIENATDPSSNLFKDRGVYQLTPKGLHVLERFISKNGVNSDHLQPVFSSQPICVKLLHLERRSIDDEIIVTQSVITALFRRFVGRQPNYASPADKPMDAFQKYNERSKGIALNDVTERALAGKPQQLHKHCFPAVTALEWLCDFTSVVGREEAAEMAAQFVRFGLITLVSDKRKNNDSAIIFTVRGSTLGGNSLVSVSLTFF